MSLLLAPSNTLLGKLLRAPLKLIPSGTVVTVRRGLTRGMRWRVGSSVHGCWLGTYELAKQQAVRAAVKPGMRVFDIGANAGFYTLAFSSLVGADGHVWAFEPFAENAGNLVFHLRINAVSNATAVQCSVSDRQGLAGFRIADSNSMGAVSASVQEYLVPTVCLDSLDFPTPHVVKVDVEGGELAVLRGASRLIAQRATTWFVALDCPADNAACREVFAAAGYEVRDLGGKDEIVATPVPA